ncbi:hypothetical protein BDR26DRAFT_871981 [Obelidium mucronatum]|nr:hypothetical protein BDR26DRAFT_871981 [Obelidium mucronatum]
MSLIPGFPGIPVTSEPAVVVTTNPPVVNPPVPITTNPQPIRTTTTAALLSPPPPPAPPAAITSTTMPLVNAGNPRTEASAAVPTTTTTVLVRSSTTTTSSVAVIIPASNFPLTSIESTIVPASSVVNGDGPSVAMVGGIAGGVAGVLLFTLIACCVCKKQKKKRSKEAAGFDGIFDVGGVGSVAVNRGMTRSTLSRTRSLPPPRTESPADSNLFLICHGTRILDAGNSTFSSPGSSPPPGYPLAESVVLVSSNVHSPFLDSLPAPPEDCVTPVGRTSSAFEHDSKIEVLAGGSSLSLSPSSTRDGSPDSQQRQTMERDWSLGRKINTAHFAAAVVHPDTGANGYAKTFYHRYSGGGNGSDTGSAGQRSLNGSDTMEENESFGRRQSSVGRVRSATNLQQMGARSESAARAQYVYSSPVIYSSSLNGYSSPVIESAIVEEEVDYSEHWNRFFEDNPGALTFSEEWREFYALYPGAWEYAQFFKMHRRQGSQHN